MNVKSVQHSPEESAPLLKTEPVIPNPINSKFKSTPLEQGSVSPSMLISNSEGSIFQPRGGIPFQKERKKLLNCLVELS